MKSSDAKFEGTWEAQDGYVSGSRPQGFTIPADEIDAHMSENDLRDLFWDWLKVEFENTVSYHSDDEAAFIEWAQSIQKGQTDA